MVNCSITNNNHLEGFHSQLNRSVGLNNPSFHRLVPKLNNQIERNRIRLFDRFEKNNRNRIKTKTLIKNKNLFQLMMIEDTLSDEDLVDKLIGCVGTKNRHYEMNPTNMNCAIEEDIESVLSDVENINNNEVLEEDEIDFTGVNSNTKEKIIMLNTIYL